MNVSQYQQQSDEVKSDHSLLSKKAMKEHEFPITVNRTLKTSILSPLNYCYVFISSKQKNFWHFPSTVLGQLPK